MAKGIVKYIEKDRLYRYMPNNSLDKKVLDKVMHSIGSLTFVGNFFIKGFKTDGYLYELDSYDKELVKNIPLKENEYVFRYTTYNTAIGGMTPLIKINKEKLLAYFGVWEQDEVIKGFTKKGEPIEYLNLVEYYSYSFDDELFMGTKNEMEEHGMNFVDAEKTANDHLKEDKHYYSKMKYVGLAEGGLIAPNGKKSNLTPEQYKLVRTPEFKKWFGDWENDPKNASQVVDKNGEPLVVYRGYPKKRKFPNVFDYKFRMFGRSGVSSRETNTFAFYFTDKKEVAEGYGENFADDGEPFVIKEYFLNARNVFEAFTKKNEYELTFKELYDLANKTGEPIYLRQHNTLDSPLYLNSKGNPQEYYNIYWEYGNKYLLDNNKNATYSYFVDWSNKTSNQFFWKGYFEVFLNYDGIIFYETTHNGIYNPQNDDKNADSKNIPWLIPEFGDEFSKTYGVFSPNQIKLADGTNTTFDNESNDIRLAKGGEVKPKVSAKLVHQENAIEYYKNESLIEPTKEQKLNWSIYGLPEGVEKFEENFKTTIDEFYGNTKKEIENKANEKINSGFYSYLGLNPNLFLEFNDKFAEGGEIELEIDSQYKKVMNDDDFYPFIILNENGEKLGTLNLNYRNDLNGYQVSNSKVYKKGQGYGKKAYLLLIKQMDKPIISDSSLTEDAKNLWESLEKNGNAYYDTEKAKFVSIKKMAEGGEVSVEIVNQEKVFNKNTYKGIYGDNDHDGLLNADDPNPNAEGDKESIEQVQLADLFSKLLSTKKDLDKTMYEQVDKLKEISPKGSKIYARTKTPYSILNKLINKRMLDKKDPSKGLTDMVGTTIVAKDFNDVNEIKDKVKGGALGKIVDFDDYYSNPKDGYMAYHFIVVDKDTQIPFEVQLKTKRMKLLNQASHNAYKYENLDGAKLLKYTRLVQKADEGNVRAQKTFDLLTSDLDALSDSLYKDKTKIKKYE